MKPSSQQERAQGYRRGTDLVTSNIRALENHDSGGVEPHQNRMVVLNSELSSAQDTLHAELPLAPFGLFRIGCSS